MKFSIGCPPVTPWAPVASSSSCFSIHSWVFWLPMPLIRGSMLTSLMTFYLAKQGHRTLTTSRWFFTLPALAWFSDQHIGSQSALEYTSPQRGSDHSSLILRDLTSVVQPPTSEFLLSMQTADFAPTILRSSVWPQILDFWFGVCSPTAENVAKIQPCTAHESPLPLP